MEKKFQQKKGFVRIGLEIGDHLPCYETFIDYIRSHYDLEKLGFVLIYISPEEVGAELFYEWARFFTENDICFAFLYTQQRGAPAGRKSHLTAEIVSTIKGIAGDYFLGDMIGETGGMASWPEGYGNEELFPPQNFENMQQAKDNYIGYVKNLVELDNSFGVENVLAVEATTFSRYNFEAGVRYTFLEMMCGDPEILLSSARGASRAYEREYWGCHIAHEWYGGYRQDDPLKYKRLKLAYYYAYMAGANLIYPESGDYGMRSYGYQYEADHPFCEEYRKNWSSFADFIRIDQRPVDGPKVSVAFLQGNLDSYVGWGGTTVWNQFGRKEWGYDAPEHSWNILKEVHKSAPWHDVTVFGENDMTHAPAYGMYDILPVEAPVEIMKQYDYLIFTGWNTMTEEIYENLKAYVYAGGKLLISAAHLNTSAARSGERQLIHDGKVADFFGCDLSAEGKDYNRGVKFIKESLIPGVLYPAAGDLDCDPICPGGFAPWSEVDMKGGRIAAFLADTFMDHMRKEEMVPALVENQYGDGVVTLLTSLDYPGANGVYNIYRAVVQEMMAASHRACPVKVLAGDHVRFAVYENPEGADVLYLLNTDYNVENAVRVAIHGKEQSFTLAPLEFKRMEY